MLPFIAAGAAIGALAGAQEDEVETSSHISVRPGQESAYEHSAEQWARGGGAGYVEALNKGYDPEDITRGRQAQLDLASQLERYSQTGLIPEQSDIDRSNQLATSLFGARNVALNQAFEDQFTAANRHAALMGRDMNDPILRAKLATEQTRQRNVLTAEQSAWATQYAMNAPRERLGFSMQRADMLSGLASQALANRQALAAFGDTVLNSERNWRLQTADRFGSGLQVSGGGLKGGLTGAIAGAGVGMSFAKGEAWSGSGGIGGNGPPPTQGQQSMLSQNGTQQSGLSRPYGEQFGPQQAPPGYQAPQANYSYVQPSQQAPVTQQAAPAMGEKFAASGVMGF